MMVMIVMMVVVGVVGVIGHAYRSFVIPGLTRDPGFRRDDNPFTIPASRFPC